MNRNQDRGEVGVGTLIVFIAMVLVAAIAAAVLINASAALERPPESLPSGADESSLKKLKIVGDWSEWLPVAPQGKKWNVFVASTENAGFTICEEGTNCTYFSEERASGWVSYSSGAPFRVNPDRPASVYAVLT